MIEIYVDGSFTPKNPTVVGWGYKSAKRSVAGSLTGDVCAMHQVGGEIKATMEAIKDHANAGEQEISILHDYEGVEAWANGRWKTKNEWTKAYQKFIAEARSRGITINFVKIDAGANPADRLARQATGAPYGH